MSNNNSKIKNDLIEIFLACCNEKLNEINLEWHSKKSLCIVICSKGYPEKFKKNVEIEDLKSISLQNNEFIFHAGTSKKKSKIYATGGRVLNFVCLADEFKEARDNIINKINKLNWSGGFFRGDIGHKVIDK